jgi:hypothetical protein
MIQEELETFMMSVYCSRLQCLAIIITMQIDVSSIQDQPLQESMYTIGRLVIWYVSYSRFNVMLLSQKA